MLVRSPCDSPASPLFPLLAASPTTKALPHGLEESCNGPAQDEGEDASCCIHQVRLDAENRRMAGIKLVENPSARHRQDPDAGPESNARAQAEMSQAKVGPRTCEAAEDQRENQPTRIRNSHKLIEPVS